MGQQEILDFLKEDANRWFCARDIHSALGITFGCVTRSLRSLRAGKLVYFRSAGSRGILQYKYAE